MSGDVKGLVERLRHATLCADGTVLMDDQEPFPITCGLLRDAAEALSALSLENGSARELAPQPEPLTVPEPSGHAVKPEGGAS